MKHLIFASIFAFTAVFAASASAQTVEYGKDRLGSDIAVFNMPANGSPENCQGACEANGSCVAWTFVRTGWQGPAPRCYLKNPAPPPTDSFCCVSGRK
jgi:PAN domain